MKAPKVDINAPKVDIKMNEITSEEQNIDINAPKINLKSKGNVNKQMNAPKVEIKGNIKEPSLEVNAPKIEMRQPKVEIKPKKIEVNAPKIEMKAPKVEGNIDVNAPKIEMKQPKVEVKAPKVEMKAPKVEGKIDVNAPKLEMKQPKVEVNAPKLEMKTYKVEGKIDANAPKIEMKQPKVEVKAPKLEMKAPNIKTNENFSGEISISKPSINVPSIEAKTKIEPPKIEVPTIKPTIKETKPQKIKAEIEIPVEDDFMTSLKSKPNLSNPKHKPQDNNIYVNASKISIKQQEKIEAPRLSVSSKKKLDEDFDVIRPKPRRKPSLSIPTLRPNIDLLSNQNEQIRTNKRRLSLRNPVIKKEVAPRISVRNPNLNLSDDIDFKVYKSQIIDVPRLTMRTPSKKGPIKLFASASYNPEVNYKTKVSSGINKEYPDYIATLTDLMSEDVNAPIDLSNNYKSEKKYNKYGGIEIGKPDYHLNYENRGFEINNEGEFNTNVNSGNKINIEGGEFSENILWNNKLKGTFGGVEYKLDEEPEEYVIEKDYYGYFQPIEYNIQIPSELEEIPNSKVKIRTHNPKTKEEKESFLKRRRSKVTLPPGLDEKAIIMNYKERPRFHVTITEPIEANLPQVSFFKKDNFDLDALADYDLSK